MSLNKSIKRPQTFGFKSDVFGILFYNWSSKLA